MRDELKERNILRLILIVRFACATLEVGHPILFIVIYMTNECDPCLLFCDFKTSRKAQDLE
jgi:hypothetical protein